MRVFLILSIFFLIGALYINRSYARIYDHIERNNLPNPNTQQKYSVRTDQNLLLGVDDTKGQKYVALGDSLTAGVGSKDYENTYPYIVAKKLTRFSSDVILVNLGRPGDKVSDVLRDQVPKAIKENPDYITLLIGINDLHNLKSPDEFMKSYQKIVDELKQKTHARIILITIPYLGSDELILSPHNIWIDWLTDEYNKKINMTANNSGVKLMDLYTKLKNNFNQIPGAYSSDLFHPSEKGYILWGRLIDAD